MPTVHAAGYQSHQFWDGRASSLEEQALGPITNPVERASTMPDVLRKLEATPYDSAKFREAFDAGGKSRGARPNGRAP